MTTLYITGTIKPELIEDVQDVLSQDTQRVDVFINSHGGDAYTGLAVYDMLASDERVVIHVRGFAASSAGIIAMGSDRITMTESSELMFHKSWRKYGGHNDVQLKEAMQVGDRIDKAQRKIIKDLLTEKQLADYDDGKDVYLTSKDVAKQLRGNTKE